MNTQIQRLLDAAVTEQGYPGAITEIRTGTRRWFGSAGVADTATGRPRTAQEQFRVGSITKTFTATLVLQLAAEYRLSLDDTVEKWLPGLVQGNGHDGAEITIRHLLNHTSGIYAYTLDEGMLERYWTPKLLKHRFDKLTPEELVKIAVSHTADFRPGQGWGYSNTNFVLAAMIIEKATGMSYADALAYRIARPLKLTGTYAPGYETGFRGPHTSSYSKLMQPDPDAPAHDVTELSPSYAFGVGEIISTATDLNTFLSELLGGRLLPPAQQTEMFTMTPVPDGKWLDGYSYGLGISSVTLPSGTTVYGHGGMITGTWTYLYGTRDGRHVVTQNVNGDWGMPPMDLFINVLDTAYPAA
ncbi:D-alanyl-D-alanine carboxypeptidase [Nonomuraea solani]|uniref:D-alanyl-D-alanine carboxypeptidase n=1 Tax=Nonomuraea solani TaxID=1144553 RepID=A0A1H6DVK7_9ACTN|nr:serine hydrolase domain-containing protein [Nonomuraea solani]SEG89298.1 D-alanyl-D-alanine carboxypeptidase [Nonomuraea solani]